ncbi:MAG: transporter [bacterium]|nr:transporter [bacterium]
MKKLLISVWLIIGLLVFGSANASETGHYVNGVEGVKAASVPPPGYYWIMYNAFYTTSKLNDKDGNESPVDFDLNVYANVNRFVWVSKFSLLGANYAADVLVPLVYTNLKISSGGTTLVDSSKFGLGDIVIEPFVLAWHGKRYDAVAGAGVVAPSGSYDIAVPASPGKDFWTILLTYGGTGYFDEAKTWSASLLGRYEIHTAKRESDVTAGNDLEFEWGVGKTIAKFYDVGIAGYCHWQVTSDSGAAKDPNTGKDQVYAIGPDARAFILPIKLIVSLRSQYEFKSVDRPQGIMTTLNLYKIF